VIRLGAIDCADERNTPICRAYQVLGYPTIKLFPPGLASKKFLGVEVVGASRHSVRDLRRKMADYVEEIKVKYEVEHFPSLEFFQ
jgi:thiol oxidase